MIKLTRKEFDYVKEIYDEVVIKGILNQHSLIKAYKILTNTDEETLVNVRYARKYIFSFFQYNYEYEIIDEHEQIKVQYEDEELTVKEKIDELESQLEDEELDGNQKRSIKMKLKHLHKKLESPEE